MRRVCVLLVPLLILSGFVLAQEFSIVDGVVGAVQTVAVSEDHNNVILAASGNSLHRYSLKNQRFNKLYAFKGENAQINSICFDEYLKNKFFVATDSGLYLTFDKGKSFKRVFKLKSTDISSGRILFVTLINDVVYLGTDQGLYFSGRNTYDFKRFLGVPSTSKVLWVDNLGKRLFIATSSGIYGITGNQCKRLYLSISDDESSFPAISAINIEKNRVFAAGRNGLFALDPQKNVFSAYKSVFFGSMKINTLEIMGKKIYVTTNSGLYVYDDIKDSLMKLDIGLYSNKIYAININTDGTLWVATGKGVFKTVLHSRNSKKKHDIFWDIPKIKDLHRRVLKYNEIDPSKISWWRRRAKLRALMPEVDVDYDKTIYGTYSSGGQSYVGPTDWGVGFSWDVGDLIWSGDETTIDVRSKLNTQLRIDILDEVNRVYFELKRLVIKKELKQDDQLRAEELVASLDAYTGGWFSMQI